MKNANSIINVALLVLVVGLVFILTSCASSEVYYHRMEARETARLKRIAADTLARPVQNYSSGLLLNGWTPRYNNGYDGYWYNGVYYRNSFYIRPLIRLNSNRYVVPYKKRVIRRKTVRNHKVAPRRVIRSRTIRRNNTKN